VYCYFILLFHLPVNLFPLELAIVVSFQAHVRWLHAAWDLSLFAVYGRWCWCTVWLASWCRSSFCLSVCNSVYLWHWHSGFSVEF